VSWNRNQKADAAQHALSADAAPLRFAARLKRVPLAAIVISVNLVKQKLKEKIMVADRKKLPRDSAERVSTIIPIIVALIGTLATIIVASVTAYGQYITAKTIAPTPIPSQNITALQSELSGLQGEVKSLQQQLDSISQTTTDTANAAKLARIESSINELNNRMGVIEQAILDNPEKALSITLLKKDMQVLQDKYEANTQVVQNEINRVSGLNQSLIILVMTSMVGLVSLAVANLFQIRRREKEKNDSEIDNNVFKNNSNIHPAPSLTPQATQVFNVGQNDLAESKKTSATDIKPEVQTSSASDIKPENQVESSKEKSG
jgi:hypothetical protein